MSYTNTSEGNYDQGGMPTNRWTSGCTQCGRPIVDGQVFYRYMVAEHKNNNQWYVSRRRVLDIHVCAGCHETALSALASRRRRP